MIRTSIFSVLTVALLGGCSDMVQLSTAPPTKTAEISDTDDFAIVSSGVALAFECNYESNPCREAEASIDDDDVAQVRPAYMSELTDSYYLPEPRTVFVLVGLEPGDTEMTVEWVGPNGGDHDRVFEVTVLDD